MHSRYEGIDTKLRQFHSTLAQKYRDNGMPALAEAVDVDQSWAGSVATKKLRAALIEEEAKELLEAIEEDDPEHVLKELCDLIYVTVAICAVFGMDFQTAFSRVHMNNMAKIENGTVREDGKLMKPKDHPKVKLGDLVNG